VIEGQHPEALVRGDTVRRAERFGGRGERSSARRRGHTALVPPRTPDQVATLDVPCPPPHSQAGPVGIRSGRRRRR
jgi:hypothetical protein